MIHLILVLILIGALMVLVPMDDRIRKIVNILVVVVVVLALLQLFGLIPTTLPLHIHATTV